MLKYITPAEAEENVKYERTYVDKVNKCKETFTKSSVQTVYRVYICRSSSANIIETPRNELWVVVHR